MTTSPQLIELFKTNLQPEMHVFEDRFHYIDGIWYKHDMAFEFKCKRDFYQDVLIEKHKYMSMQQHKRKRYVNLMTFESGREVVFSFNLNEFPNPEWVWKYIPNASNELYTKWEWTECALLNIRYAKNITDLIFKK
jgi:hypothetical protein